MPYDNIPGVHASYQDGSFQTVTASGQPNILVVGPAAKGRNNTRFNVNAMSDAEREFGSASPVLRVAHECLAQGADNITILRSGGRPGSWVFTDSAGGTLTIVPEDRDDTVLDNYAVIIENDSSENRILVFDLVDEEWVYDSNEILSLDSGVVTVTDTGIDLFTLNDRTQPTLAVSLGDVLTGDFVVDGVATAVSITRADGTDGLSNSLVETYAALNTSYHNLDYKDADFVVPTDVYVDAANIVDDTEHAENPAGASTDAGKWGRFWKGVPVAGSVNDVLGYAWQYVYRGQVYTYMLDVDDYFVGLGSIAAASKTVCTTLVVTAAKVGKGGNAITLEVDASGASGPTAVVTETEFGLDILVEDDGTGTTAQAATAINNALAALTLSTGVLANTLVAAVGGITLLTTAAKGNLTGGRGGAALSPLQLTGDAVPTAVATRFAAGSDSEVREINFAHQLASFCHVASTNWKDMLGFISFDGPLALDRLTVSNWIGELPEFTNQGTYKFIDAPADNGYGVLGNKFLCGQSATSAGYRAHMVTDGNSTDGFAFGGFILTTGAALPNGSKHPYGIDDQDEATDRGGKPLDIGRHIIVSYDWPVHSNPFNGGTVYRGSVAGLNAGKLATLPENQEPIGENGTVRRIQSIPRIHSTQLSNLAEARISGLRREDGLGIIITSMRTAAHPSSTWTRISSIRAVNRLLRGVRRIARPYLGKDFSAQTVMALQGAIDGYLVAEYSNKVHQGAKALIDYTRADKINGRLKIKLRIVPPFSIEFVDVETSLAADETEL